MQFEQFSLDKLTLAFEAAKFNVILISLHEILFSSSPLYNSDPDIHHLMEQGPQGEI